jgi:Amt family ammonium transporter
MIGKRLGFGKEATPPHSLTMTMIGASLLWVGWFGFNAGSNLEANGVTAVAFVNTMVATCAAAVSWAIVEQLHHGKPSMLGGRHRLPSPASSRSLRRRASPRR